MDLAKPPPWPRLASWLRLVGRLQFGLLPLLVMASPLTGLRFVWGHDLLGGMFLELTAGDVFLVVLPLFICAWSAMATVGLLIEGSKLDPRKDLPPWTRVFDLPPRAATFFAFPLLAVPGIGVMVWSAGAPVAATVAAAGAAIAAYVGAVVVAGALTAAQPNYVALPDPLARWLARVLARSRTLVGAVRWLRRQASRATWPPFDGSWDPEAGAMDIDHFVAAGFCVATLAAFLVEAYLFRPWNRAAATLPSAALVVTMGTVLIWVFGALTFHLRRYRLSPVLMVVALAAGGYWFWGYDHHFHVHRLPAPAPLSAADVVAPVGDGNVVVVTSTGGGIIAAGWTTLALQELIHARPVLRSEIRLVSGVSGGSVGAAFYLAGLREQAHGVTPARALDDVLGEAQARSVASSLDAVAYGLVFLDLPRLLTGDIAFRWTGVDRGYLLEKRWRNLAAGVPVSVHDLTPDIRAGLLPAPIFNITAMETGRRVMATPVTFEPADHDRAPTLDEYLSAPAGAATGAAASGAQVDLDMWTAARLSATFPFVGPAARAIIDRRFGEGAAGHHMIDGGYNDNYGVASALDFLAPVMAARLAGRLAFKRLLIIQLRCSNAESPVPRPAPGIEASLLGPLIGILNVRDGATLPRNEAAVEQFIALWQGRGDVNVKTIVFQPQRRDPGSADDEEPLSWHLTQAQKAALRRRWQSQPGLGANLCAMGAYLEGTTTDGCPRAPSP